MRLKTFQAASMSEAMRQIREELGDDAVIVATHRSRRGRGVEITAALEPHSTTELPGGASSQAEPVRADVTTGTDDTVADAGEIATKLTQALAFHGLKNGLSERLCLAASNTGDADAIRSLSSALKAHFRFSPLPVAPTQPLLLAGPPGSGKTIATAKLAARAVLAGHKVTVITCDTVRAGGVEQLDAFISLLRQPLIAVDNSDALAEAVDRSRGNGPIFIDTPGTNPYSDVEFGDLRACIQASGAEAVLVLPTGGDSEESAEAAASFAHAGVTGLLPTRLDVARRHGSILAAAHGAALQLVGASTTGFVAEGLRVLSATALARLLLRNPGDADLDSDFDEVVS